MLAGFSVGGITALETALELHRRGLRPLGLMLLDTIHPDAVFGGAAFWRVLGWLVCKLHMQELSEAGWHIRAGGGVQTAYARTQHEWSKTQCHV